MTERISEVENIGAFALDLASQSRDGHMNEGLMLKSFRHYKLPLLALSTKTYLLDPNIDDESYNGEGRLLKSYLNYCGEKIFSVDNTLFQSVDSLSQYILDRGNRQIVGSSSVSAGTLLFEFGPEVEIEKFDWLFSASFFMANISVRDLRKTIPFWGKLVKPGIVKGNSIYMCFIALGEQLILFGPRNTIDTLQERARLLLKDWSKMESFLDTI